MADVRPLQGLRFNPAQVDVARVTCPPYDVISPEEQRRLHELDPHNVVRIELGMDGEERYARAAAFLNDWQAGGVLLRDRAPSVYVYDQSFSVEGAAYTRRGVFCAVRLGHWGEREVLPHEHTLDKPKADRLALMRACRANVSPIFSLYPSARTGLREALAEVAEQSDPEVDFSDEAGVRHRLWPTVSAEVIGALTGSLRRQPLFIADGHHRYETCLAYRDERRAAEPRATADAAFNFTLMALLDMDDPGLVILPIHRLISRLDSARLEGFANRLEEWFDVQEMGSRDDGLPGLLAEMRRRGEKQHVFGAYDRGWPGLRLLMLRQTPRLASALDGTRSAAWRNLDVVLLHALAIERALGIDEASLRAEANLSYTTDAAEALSAVRSGQQQVALFVNPTRLSDVRDVALAGDRMPQKCTFFSPKLRTGLVINLLDGGQPPAPGSP